MTQNILGTWDLVRFEITAPDGTVKAWGPNARGQLIYTDDGRMSVAINRDQTPAESKAQAILNSILFYAGTYSVAGNVIQHSVHFASNPDRIGREMIRYAEFHGDEIHLKTPQESFGVANLVWRRLG
jgi:hypothetical protein